MLAHPRSLALLLSVSVSTACAVGRHYETPEIPLSASFVGQEAVERREVQTKAVLRPGGPASLTPR